MDGIRKGERHGSNMRRLVLFLAFVTSHGATHTFGGTDALGWTDSASYEGSQYTVSRVTATVARETAITAATLGIGTAARGGSAAAQAAYKGILVTEAATGGYQIGKGAGQIAEGDYEAGALNVVAGGLRVGGSIVSAGAVPSKGQKVYRVFGENNKPLGESWTPPVPRAALSAPSSARAAGSETPATDCPSVETPPPYARLPCNRRHFNRKARAGPFRPAPRPFAEATGVGLKSV